MPRERCPAEEWNHLAPYHEPPKGRCELIPAGLLTISKHDSQLVIEVPQHLDELSAEHIDLVGNVRGERGVSARMRAARSRRSDAVGPAVNEVHHSLQRLLGVTTADGVGDHDGPRPQSSLNRSRAGKHVRAGTIALVHKADGGHRLPLHLPPDGLGLGLNAGSRVNHEHGPVEHPHRALNLNGEVHVAGCVHEVDLDPVPANAGRRRGDGDPPLTLLAHPVHDRGAFVHAPNVPFNPRLVENALGQRGLAGIDVGANAHVAQRLQPLRVVLARVGHGRQWDRRRVA